MQVIKLVETGVVAILVEAGGIGTDGDIAVSMGSKKRNSKDASKNSVTQAKSVL